MPRTGLEPKPAWDAVPPAVRRAAEELLGAEVRRAMRVWGGYSPTPTYRLRLADGRRVFFKGTGPSVTDVARAAHPREERVYRELGDFIGPWAPAFYGSFRCGDWDVMLLEDLGPKSAPPWPPALARRVARACGDFHRATLGLPLPAWIRQPEDYLSTARFTWAWAAEPDALGLLAGLAGERVGEALRWLDAALPALASASRTLADLGPPHALLHLDIRSDNLRWTNGRLYLFDWPHVGAGPAEFDAAAFAQSITVEGGPEAEQVMAWYAERAPLRPEVLDASVAAIAGFFAHGSWRPDIPGLPRLRTFQRRQLRVTLAWAARRLSLPDPSWLGGIPT